MQVTGYIAYMQGGAYMHVTGSCILCIESRGISSAMVLASVACKEWLGRVVANAVHNDDVFRNGQFCFRPSVCYGVRLRGGYELNMAR